MGHCVWWLVYYCGCQCSLWTAGILPIQYVKYILIWCSVLMFILITTIIILLLQDLLRNSCICNLIFSSLRHIHPLQMLLPTQMLTMDKVLVPFGWTTWLALVLSTTWPTVPMMLTQVTVVTLRMLVFSAIQHVCLHSATHKNSVQQPIKSYEAMRKC